MKRIVLSDHAADQAKSLEDGRKRNYLADLARYQAATSAREQRISTQRARLSDAWRRGEWWKAIKGFFGVLREKGRPVASLPVLVQASRDEIRWVAGSEGEARVAERLAARLDDTWTLVTGYRGSKGEIDGVLVGPKAVIALETKFTNGTVHVDGDDWVRDKFDSYGNLVEQRLPMRDRGGRSPSQQINATADELLGYLGRRFGVKEVCRVVVLSHDKAELGRVRSPTVHAIKTLDRLDGTDLVSELRDVYDAPKRQLILDALVNAHARFERRGQESGRATLARR